MQLERMTERFDHLRCTDPACQFQTLSALAHDTTVNPNPHVQPIMTHGLPLGCLLERRLTSQAAVRGSTGM